MRDLLLGLSVVFVVPTIGIAQSTGTQMRHAVFAGDDATVRKLATDKDAVNVSSSDGVTPLMIASALGRSDTVKVLLGAGAEIAARTKFGVTALMFAVCFGQLKVTETLVEAGADIAATIPGPRATGYSAADFSLAPCQGSHELSPESRSLRVAVGKYLISKGAVIQNFTGSDIQTFLAGYDLKKVLDKAQAEP